MIEFKNTELELQRFQLRLFIAGVFVLLCFCGLFARFVWLQVVKYDDYHAQAEENRISVVPIAPNRGVITDRNGVVLARNYSAYTLEVTPSKLGRDLDAVIEDLATLVDIQPHHRRKFKKLLEESKSFESLPLRTRLTDDEVAKFAAQRFRFPGVEIRARLFREYPLGETAAHVIGYIGRISQRDEERIAQWENASDYVGTQYVGKIGVEQSYEKELHGTTGFEEVEVSAGGRAVKTLSRTPAQPGNNLVLSIDVKLQALVEELYGDRKGAFVAIEPKTGDVLAFVSKPTFDPNMFVEGIDPVNWEALNTDPDKPLLNRPLRGTYPPGSTFKPFMALAGLETGKRTPQFTIHDPGYFMFGNHQFRDSKAGGNGTVDLHKSIVVSSDTYYYQLANDLTIDTIHDFMKPFGFGQKTGIDIEGERIGVLPSTEWKRGAFKNAAAQRWYLGETISVGIGQGYNSYTLLQLANAVAILANNGVAMKPHLVRSVENVQTGEKRLTVPTQSYTIPLKREHIDFVKAAMVDVARVGTAAGVFGNAPYAVAAKTGTAQVIGIKQGEKYNASRIAERFRDHSLFIALAPADDPKIAIALIVENGGWGAQAAAPIARKALDFWLLGKLPDAVKPAVEPSAAEPEVEEASPEERGLPPVTPPDVEGGE